MIVNVNGSAKPLSHWPGDLSMFGRNPFGKPMYRMVWSESRQYMVGGAHVKYDQSAGGPSKDAVVEKRGFDPNQLSIDPGYQWKQLYVGRKCWVLEHWKSAYEFTGMGPDRYEREYRDKETGLLALGPYPTEGEYDECFIFPAGINVGISTVIELIQDIEHGRGYTFAQRQAAYLKEMEKDKKHNANLMDSIFTNSQQAFKNKPSNVRPGKHKEIKLKYTAEELGLPRPHSGLSAGVPRKSGQPQPQRG